MSALSHSRSTAGRKILEFRVAGEVPASTNNARYSQVRREV
jgi:hypothetical protein